MKNICMTNAKERERRGKGGGREFTTVTFLNLNDIIYDFTNYFLYNNFMTYTIMEASEFIS